MPHIPQGRSMLKIMGLLLAILLLTGAFLTFRSIIPTANDAAEAANFVDVLTSQFPFQGQDHGRPSVFFRPHPGYSEILIYGKYTEAERSQICQIALKLRKEQATKPVRVRFYQDRKEVHYEIIP